MPETSYTSHSINSGDSAHQAPLVFVTGTQRCGTTLTCRILDAHPGLDMVNEVLSPDELDAVFASENCERSLRTALKRKGLACPKGSWGLKHPYLTYHLENIARRFPTSRIVIVMRDGRAVAHSYLKVKWGIANIHAGAHRWKSEVRKQDEFRDRHPGAAFLLRYEALLTEPEAGIRELCAFLGLEYETSLLEFYKQPVRFQQHKNNLNTARAIDPQLKDAWRRGLTPFQIKVFEAVAGGVLQSHGYPVEHARRGLPAPLRCWYALHQRVVGELQIQFKWRLQNFFEKKIR
jgi:hypothetical protein